VVWVRTEDDAPARPFEPADLAAEGGKVAVRAHTQVALDAGGPFEAVAVAVERSAALRDALVRGLAPPSVARFARLRFALLAVAAPPALMLLELDRELVMAKAGSVATLLADLVLAAYVAFELTRRSPRLPGVAAAALASFSLRFVLVATRLCAKGVHPAVWAGALLAAAGAAGILARAPSRERVVLELLDKLGISRSDLLASREERRADNRLVAAAVIAAIGLPLSLLALRRAGVDVWAQAGAFVVYAVVVPEIVRRFVDPSRAPPPPAPAKVLFGVACGLALTAALAHGAHHFFDAGNELARCTGKLDAEAKRLLAREAAETSSGIARVRASSALVMMTVAFIPLAEERIYRGLLMDVLVRRYGASYGLFASAVVFGVAHLGVYQVALYQAVLLGLAFGLAFAEGGLVAAFVVHAAWNLLLLA
jgi:hypothetical protein